MGSKASNRSTVCPTFSVRTLTLSNNPTYPTPIATKGDPATLFSNNSAVDSIFISDKQSFSVGSTNDYIVLNPLSSVSILPQTDLYAAGINNDTLDVIPGGINIFEIPVSQNVLIPEQGLSLNGGFSKTFKVPVSTSSYSINLTFYNSQSAVAAPTTVDVAWQDAATGITLDHQIWKILQGANAANPHTIIGKGPTAGNQLVISVSNDLLATTMTATISLLETTNTYTTHDWRTDSSPTSRFSIAGFVGASINHDSLAGILGQLINSPITANNTNVYLLPLYSGIVNVWGLITTAAGNPFAIYIKNEADSFATALGSALMSLPGPEYLPGGTSQQLAGNVIFPRAQCSLRIDNNTAAAANLYAGLTCN